jgi:tetratricopeptide (TPR) repeat protein
MQSKNPDRALEDFNRAIALEPDNFTAHVGRGDALMAFELPQREDAIAAYDRAIVLNPNYHQAWANRGIALTSSGQLIEAVESYNRALEIDIDGNDAVDNLKETLNSLIETWFSGSAANSINLSRATTVTVNDPDQESESYRVGPSISTGFDLDDEDAETIAAASALLLQRDPQDADAFYYQGFSLIVTEQYTAAIEQLNRALTLRPEFPEAYITRGLARKRQGDEEGAIADLKLAIADYTRAIEHKPEDATLYNARGNAHRYQRDFAAAIADYTRAIEINPEDANAYNNRGVVRRNQGELDAAIADYTRAIEINPEDAIAYYNRGLAYRELQRYQESLSDLNRAIELGLEEAILDRDEVLRLLEQQQR